MGGDDDAVLQVQVAQLKRLEQGVIAGRHGRIPKERVAYQESAGQYHWSVIDAFLRAT